MHKRARFLVVITAVLLTGIVPAGDACSLDSAVFHACCAGPETPAPSSSCCESAEPTPRASESSHDLGCTCDHPPTAPTALVNHSGGPGADDSGSPAYIEVLPADGFDAEASGLAGQRVLSHPPPPSYLLNCANLN